jgi:hypothetical protein
VRPSHMTFGVIKRYADDRKTEVLWIKGELRWIPAYQSTRVLTIDGYLPPWRC